MLVIAHRANGFGCDGNTVEALRRCVPNFIPEIDVREWPIGKIGHDVPSGLTIKEASEKVDLGRCLIHVKDEKRFIGIGLYPRWQPKALDLIQADSESDLMDAANGAVVTDIDPWLTAPQVAYAHRRGRVVLVAGPKTFSGDRERLRELFTMGVDGILTDDPIGVQYFLDRGGM